MSPRRRGLSKKKRYGILARDGFACRYCGANADSAPLVVDHIVPVVLGGTNDPENLITACEPCNQGKAARTPTTAAPTERDAARLAESVRRQREAAELVAQVAATRAALRQELINLWCGIRETDEVDGRTIRSMLTWHREVGAERLARWIRTAHRRKHWWSDYQLCRYIGGIRRNELERERLVAEGTFGEDDVSWDGPLAGTTREATTDDR